MKHNVAGSGGCLLAVLVLIGVSLVTSYGSLSLSIDYFYNVISKLTFSGIFSLFSADGPLYDFTAYSEVTIFFFFFFIMVNFRFMLECLIMHRKCCLSVQRPARGSTLQWRNSQR